MLASLLCFVLNAQEFRATIAGHVLDSSGASVPSARVQAVNTATKESATAVTDAAGGYSIPFLRPGAYQISISATGFKQNQRDVVVEAAKTATVDAALEVGQMTETIQVTAEAVSLETQSASRGGVVTQQQVSELPLNARNPFMLGAMMSGVTFNGAAIWQRPFDNGAIAEWSINGGRNSSAEYFMDGASNNGQMGNNNIAYVPTVDAVQEFNMMTNMYNAEYGHTGSGIMNVVLKSGGAQHHGTAYEFLRRTPLDANTFQNNATRTARPTHYLDQYGGQLDGPVYIPKLMTSSSRVKLFYMGALELYREGTPNPLILSYPEPEMRTGDFSKLVTATGAKVIIADPLNDASGQGTSRLPFPNNTIPASRINPIAKAVTGYMPLPNRAAPGGFRYANGNLLQPGVFDKDKFYNLIMKFDWNFGDKHRAYVRHASNDRTEDRPVNGIDNKPGTDGQQPFQRINDAYVLDWVSTISPTLIFNVRGSFNRFIEKGFGRANQDFDLKSLGISQSLISQLPNQDKAYFGRWTFDSGYQALGRSQSNNYSNTYELMSNITKIKGAHTIKGGFDLRKINWLQQNTGDILAFNGQAQWTQENFSNNQNAGVVSGDGYASFLLGLVSGSSNYPLFPWWKQTYTAFYLNDDYKVSRKLTLQLGLRYDLNYAPTEKWNRLNGAFDPNVASPLAAQLAPNVASLQSRVPTTVTINNVVTPLPAAFQDLARQAYGNLATLKGGLTFAGVNGVPSRPHPLDKNNLQPRFGLAYNVNDKFVIRTGFGQYYANPNNDWLQASGFSTSTNIVNTNDGGRTPIANILSNPYPNGIIKPTGSTAGAATFAGRGYNWFDSNFQIPSVWQYSFGFQYQVQKDAMLDVSYVGSRSYNLNMGADFNYFPLNVRKQCNFLEGGNPAYCNLTQVPNPFLGNPAFAGTNNFTATTISLGSLLTPYPQFGGISQLGRNDAWIKYNSLQINYRWRMRGGVNFFGNYTLSKQIELSNFNDRQAGVYQQGLYFLDRPQVLKANVVWELPFGKGKKFASASHGFVDRLVSGWEYNAFYVNPFKGFPANLPGNAVALPGKDPAKIPGGGFTGSVDWKANQVREWNPCVLRTDPNTGVIAPTSASLGLGCGTDFSNNFGNYAWLETAGFAPRLTPFRSGQIRVHHAFQMDMSILKRTRITERVSTQVGVEGFNVFNHNYFGRDNLNTNPEDARFGSVLPATVSTQNMLPRQFQIRMKVNW